jgi:hypothetical protein
MKAPTGCWGRLEYVSLHEQYGDSAVAFVPRDDRRLPVRAGVSRGSADLGPCLAQEYYINIVTLVRKLFQRNIAPIPTNYDVRTQRRSAPNLRAQN